MSIELPKAKSLAVNPTQAEMKAWVLEHTSNVTETEFGNVNYKAEVLARMSGSTFFVSETEQYANRISREEYNEWAAKQDAHIAEQDMVLVEGYIGPDPTFKKGSRMMIERMQSNIAGMQQQLFFPRDDEWEPMFTVIYTPTLRAPGKPDDRLILVDLDNYVTRVFGSDYFGESKMGSLRMWNHYVYTLGGLGMHSGLKSFPDINGDEKVALILGLSGTGKTTTTFRQQLGSLPVQDDFTGLMPGGTIYTTENGCFAKTYGLDPVDEPSIHGGTTRADAWLENTHVDSDGTVDFWNDDHTRNGRSTFPLANIEHRNPVDLPKVDTVLLLNRNENIIPAVARIPREKAAAYFMLGETKGTSAGGAAEAGKNLRVPGTNPFFFTNDALQGNRYQELMDTMPDLALYVMNTGSVGGAAGEDGAKKVKIPHSSAIVEGIMTGTIEWEMDPDFGYEVATSIPGLDDAELLQPRKLYEAQGRMDEYNSIVANLKEERKAYLEAYDDLNPAITASI